MKKSHIVLYITSAIWDLLICWPVVVLLRLFWGENLRWERNRDPKTMDGLSLWCDLKKGSWPTRTWYGKFESGNWLSFLKGGKPIINHENRQERYGLYRTWGGTTLGHGGFYGPGVAEPEGWTRTQDHEHHHVEQFEASMLRSFVVGLVLAIALLAVGHPVLALVLGLLYWWSGGFLYGVSSAITAALRGEDGYRGSHIEEAAYKLDDDWRDGLPKKDEG